MATLEIGSRRFLESIPPSGSPPLYRVKHWPVGSPYRDGRPEVVPLLPVHKTYFNREWQLFYFQLTYRFWGAFDIGFAKKRWTSLNGTALALMNQTGFPGHINYILGQDIGAPLPAYDKTRTMGGSVVTGYEQDGLLYVETLNGNESPPDVDWVLERPWYYFYCVLALENRVGLFPQGCDKERGIWQPTIAPLVARQTVALDLDDVERVYEIPDPFEL